MLKNYFKIAIRSLFRQRGFSFINIFGLAIGIAVFILISLIVFDQLNYDQFHEKKENIYRVNSVTEEYGIVTASSWRLGEALKTTYPEIVDYSRYCPWGTSLIKYEDKVYNELNLRLADPSFFQIFSFDFTQGDAQSALAEKHSIVLTSETAARYFGDKNPIGKTLFVREYDSDFTVSGVIENIPDNSSLQFDLLARVDLMPRQRLESWEYTGYTFILLNEKVDTDRLNQKIATFYQKYVSDESTARPVLQPLTDIHLYEHGEPGIIKYIYIFSIIAVFILLIACINFMNLSTARSAKRAREIGIRKVVGAYRRQLINQFLGESIFISFIALIFALLMVELILPFFNEFANKELSLFSFRIYKTTLFLIGLTFITGLLAGSYPAFYLSSFRPSKILKGDKTLFGRQQSFRRVLSISQFTIAIGLIICTILVHNQIHLIKNKDIGINRELVIGLLNNPDLNNQFDTYRSELLNSPYIGTVTASATNPFDVGQSISINWEGHLDQDQLPLPYTMVDYDFFKTFQMDIVEGRAFSKENTSDKTEACIINETAAKAMGLTVPVGTEIYFDHPAFEESFKKVRIIGVVQDFHHSSFHKKIRPFIFRIYRPWHSFIFIKITGKGIKQALAHIKETTQDFAPEYPFEFRFMDEIYNTIYTRELIMGKILNVFAFLAILISCLGLYGLAAFTTEQRTKEIGIRKVLGGSVFTLIAMLSKEFTRWVLVANVIAWPLAWVAMSRWLQNFEYKIDIGWWVFFVAGGLALLIALVTVSSQAIKAALANPVKALRYE